MQHARHWPRVRPCLLRHSTPPVEFAIPAPYTCRGDDISVALHRGIGIAPEFLPRVFDLFVQGDQTRSRTTAGMGVGLHLVKRIVEFHGGSVEVFSAGVGSGSSFTVRLPRHV